MGLKKQVETSVQFLGDTERAFYILLTRTNNTLINFLAAGENNVSLTTKVKYYGDMGVLTKAKDWIVIADLEKTLKFTDTVRVGKLLRPEIIIYS